jgi:methylglyoxal synthase
MVMFVAQNLEGFNQCELLATGATGRLIAEKTGLKVHLMQGGPEGGDLQIGALVASREVDLVIFLRDPLEAQPHDPDISALLRVCDVHNIPLATNLASAELLLDGLSKKKEMEDASPNKRSKILPQINSAATRS